MQTKSTERPKTRLLWPGRDIPWKDFFKKLVKELDTTRSTTSRRR